MEQRQPPIYYSCLQLSRLVFSITRHFPKKANYEEGAELRRASVEAVKECLLANRSQRGSPERKHHQERLADALTLIEALVSVINEEKAWQTMLYYNDHLRGDAIRFCQRMNSYFGILSHFKTYRIRKELVHLVPTEWWDKVYVEGHYEKFAIRKNNQLEKSMNKVNAFARNRTFGN